MTQSITGKEANRRLSVAASVASRYGIDAPYPNGIARYKYTVWLNRKNRFNSLRAKFETQLAEAADGQGKVKDLDRCYSAMRAALVHRDRVKLQNPYLSWAHVAAFLTTPTNGADDDVRTSASPVPTARLEARGARILQPAAAQ